MTYQEAYNALVNTLVAAQCKLSENQKIVLAGALAVVHEKIKLDEREACAKIAEDKGLTWKSREDIEPDNAKRAYMASQFIAQAIRARGGEVT